MSDITGRAHKAEGQELSEEKMGIPHTGRLSEGHPFREEPPKNDDVTDKFGGTPLERATNQHIVLPHDTNSLSSTESSPYSETTTSEVAWYKKTPVKIVGVAAIALTALGIGLKVGGADGESVATTPATVPDIRPGTSESTTSETSETSTASEERAPVDSDPIVEFENIQRTLFEYDQLQIEPVTNPDPAVYIRDMNYLVAIAVMDESEDRSEEAIKTLTGGHPESLRFADFLRGYRQDNYEIQGSSDTFISEPGTLEVLRSGDDFAVIKTTNVTLYILDEKRAYPQRIEDATSESYYYVRIDQRSGNIQLIGAYDTLTNWQGKGNLGL